jgi:hypothetical protein
MTTFSDSRNIRQMMGINACRRVGLRFSLSINGCEEQIGKIIKEFNGTEANVHYKIP